MGKGKSLVSFFLLPLIIGLALLCVVGAVLYYLGIQQPLETQAKQLIGSQIEERADLIEQKNQSNPEDHFRCGSNRRANGRGSIGS